MASPETIQPARFDLLDPELVVDPYPAYRRLRAVGPLARGGPGQWVVSRHSDVSTLLRDRRLGVEWPESYQRVAAGDGPALGFRRRILLTRDPPAHTDLVRLMGELLSPTAVRARGPLVRGLVDDLLDSALDAGHFDAVRDLAFPLATTVLCDLLGLPREVRPSLAPQMIALGRAFLPIVPPQDRASVDAVVTELRDVVRPLLATRGESSSNDLMSVLAGARRSGRLTEEDVVDNVVFLAFAGFETTVNLMAGGCALLAEHPDQFARLRADRSLVPRAVEEFARFISPIQASSRLVLEPVRVGGRLLRPGRGVLLLLGSANHDDSVFDRPDCLDLRRDPNPHVAFGGGVHYCLGAALSRLEAGALFARLAQRCSALAPAGPVQRENRPVFRALLAAPITARPA
jgi:cytochrome P450